VSRCLFLETRGTPAEPARPPTPAPAFLVSGQRPAQPVSLSRTVSRTSSCEVKF